MPNPRVGLYHMACAVDEEKGGKVTFLYQFAKGASNRSHGVNVARLAGLPEPVLDKAAEKSAELEQVLDDKYALLLAKRVLRAADGELQEPMWNDMALPDDALPPREMLLKLWHEAHAMASRT